MENIENNNLIDDIDQGTNPCNVLETGRPRKRNRLGLFVLITITVLFLLIGIGLGIFFGVKNRDEMNVNINIDPQIISSDGSITHALGAISVYFHGGDETQREYSSNLNISIDPENYIRYAFTFNNKGKVKAKYKVEFYDIVAENVNFVYQIEDGEKITCDSDTMDWIQVNVEESSHFYLYMNIIDKHNNATLSGEYCLILMEVDD